MRIEFIELKNFRNIVSQEISFKDKDFVVLIGDNGSGKTSILEAITKAYVPVLRAINSEAMKNCDLTNGDIQSGTSGTSVKIGIALDGKTYVWTNRRRLSAAVPFEDAEQKQNDLKELKVKYGELVEKKQLPLVLYYGTDRIIREVPQRGHIRKFEITDALGKCFDNVILFRDFYDWFKTEEDVELRGLRQDPFYKNPRLNCVREALARMIKGYTNLRIELNPSRMLITNDKDVDLRIDQLSGGYKAILSVVADIAKRLSMANPNSENPLEEEAVILIDELDLHLHPNWQKTIVDDLKRCFPNCQFIISTHSPFIIQSLKANELFDIRTMQYADKEGSYKGWSIENIQENLMGVEQRTSVYNDLIQEFSHAIDSEDAVRAKQLYQELKKMMNQGSPESRLLDMDMEMMEADDKAE